MRRGSRILGLVLVAGIALIGCRTPDPSERNAPHATRSTPADPPSPSEAAPHAWAQARRLQVVKCARCHQLYPPQNYTPENWQRWMVKMSRKARLNADERALLTRYFDSTRREAGAE